MGKFKDRRYFFIITYLPFIFIILSSLRFPPLSFAQEDNIKKDADIARHLFRDSLYEMAINAFEAIVKRDPNSPEAFDALYYIAESLFALEKWEPASEKFNAYYKRAKRQEQKVKVIPHFVHALVMSGELSGAVSLYEEWLDINQDKSIEKDMLSRLTETKQKLARSFLEDGEYRKARETYDELLENVKDVKKELIFKKGIADSLFYLKNWQESIEVYKDIRKKYPDDDIIEKVCYQIILAQFAQKNWLLVLEEAGNFLVLYPSSPLRVDILYLKAWAFYKSGDTDKAVEYLLSNNETAPVIEWQTGYEYAMADEAWMRRDYHESVKYLRKILTVREKDYKDKPDSSRNIAADENISPSVVDAKNGIKDSLISQNAWDDLSKGFYNERTLWLVRLRLADSLWRAWRFNDSMEVYKQIQDGNAPDDLKALARFTLGRNYFDIECFDIAYEIFSSVHEPDSEYLITEKALFLSAQSLSFARRWEEAQNIFRRLSLRFTESMYLEEAEWGIAKSYYNACDFQRALEYLKGFTDDYPDSSFSFEAAYITGWSYIYLEELGYAKKTFQSLLQKNPGTELTAKAIYSLGMIHFQEGEYKKAIDIFSDAISRANDRILMQNAQFMIALGSLFEKGYSTAIEIFQKLSKEMDGKQRDEVLLILGWAWQLEGDYKKANDEFKRIVEKHENRDDFDEILPILWRMAKNSYILENYEDTTERIDQILYYADNTPYKVCARLLSLQVLLDKKDYKGFLEEWEPFLDKNPVIWQDSNQDFSKAQALFNKGEFHQAGKLYKELAIEYSGRHEEADALLELGKSREAQGLYKSALKTYNRLMNRCRSNECKIKAHQALGELFYKLRNHGYSIRHLQRVLSADVASDIKGRCLYFLGLNYKSLGRKNAAIEKFRKVLNHNKLECIPADEMMELGLFLEGEGEYDMAISLFSNIVDSKDNNAKVKAEAQYWIGECHQKAGDLKKAILEYLKVNYLYPEEHLWGITARYKSAEIYREMGDLDKALNLYRKVEEHSIGTQYGKFAGERAEEIENLLKQDTNAPLP